jgi:hypothetical protein
LKNYRDITEFPGTYINLSFSQSWKVYKEISLDFGASAGYFAGDSDTWKTFESSTGGITGEKYRPFHDGMAAVGFTVPIGKNFSVQPVVQYWVPLSSEASRTVNGNWYNPAGEIDEPMSQASTQHLAFKVITKVGQNGRSFLLFFFFLLRP